jgi:phosphoglycolate phosphatase
LKLIVFDVDGTLVDSQDLIVAAQGATFRAHGLEPPTRARSLSIVGLSLVPAFRVLAGPDGPAESLAEGYKTAFQRLRADPSYREPLFPGAAELLQELVSRDDVLLGIATGKSRRGIAHLLERHGWARIFSTIQTADDHPSKPHPAMLEQALAETGAEARDAVIVGDSTFDMAMARAAGVGAIGVSWGYHRTEALRETGADMIVNSYRELRDHLHETLLATSLV